jgi:hypothetical protein
MPLPSWPQPQLRQTNGRSHCAGDVRVDRIDNGGKPSRSQATDSEIAEDGVPQKVDSFERRRAPAERV